MTDLFAKLTQTERNRIILTFEHSVKSGMLSSLNQECGERVRFLQIGGNDGLMADPLRPFLKQFPWIGGIFEPIPEHYASLQGLYSAKPDIKVINAAISEEDGSLVLYKVNNSQGKYPRWSEGLASNDVNHLRRHGIAMEDCEKVEVPCMTPVAALAETGSSKFDLLCVDVEGHELPIFRSLPLAGAGLKLGVVECKHMGATERLEMQAICGEAGLDIFFLLEDAVIVAKTDNIRNHVLRTMQNTIRKILQ